MARYTGPDCKRCRREKVKLFLKGSKCISAACPLEKRAYPPGQHGNARTKESEYLLQMREKQKAARIYGVLERQFRRYYEEANRRPGKTGDNLLIILESRLDNVVYRMGFGSTRAEARQLVGHKAITVNGQPVTCVPLAANSEVCNGKDDDCDGTIDDAVVVREREVHHRADLDLVADHLRRPDRQRALGHLHLDAVDDALDEAIDPGSDVGARDHPDVHVAHVRQDRDVEPGALDQWPERIDALEPGAGDVQRERRAGHVGDDQVVDRAM